MTTRQRPAASTGRSVGAPVAAARRWRMALRVAWRGARRAKGRTALVVALIGLPVLGMTYLATVADMHRLTLADRAARGMGSAEALVYPGGSGHIEPIQLAASYYTSYGAGNGPLDDQTLLRYLPAGSTVTTIGRDFDLPIRTPAGGATEMTAYYVDGSSPLTHGLLRVLSGRAPRTGSEAALTPEALKALHAHVGGTVQVYNGATYRVVGTAEISGRIETAVVLAPVPGKGGAWLVGQSTPMRWPQIQDLNRHGFMVQSADLVEHPPASVITGNSAGDTLETLSLGTIVAGIGLLEVVLLAGPAFAVGARRRQRDLALVAANGGTPATLRTMVLADGIVAGLLAAAVGGALGIAAAFSTRGIVEQHIFHERLAGYRTDPVWLLGIAAVAILIGTVAALIPAITTSRVPVVRALSGLRGIRRTRIVWPLLGLGLVVLAVLVVAFGVNGANSRIIVCGLGVGELGMVVLTPTLIAGIAKSGRFLPLVPRIVLRNAARRRASTSPAISAVMAAVAGSIAVTMYLSSQVQSQPTYAPFGPPGMVAASINSMTSSADPTPVDAATLRSRQDQVVAALGAVFPGAPTAVVSGLSCDGSRGICEMTMESPPDRACPYKDDGRPLSRADQIKARADQRCQGRSWETGEANGQVVTDDPTVVHLLTGLTGVDLDRAVAMLRAGGVLAGDPAMIENGYAWLVPDGAPTPIKVPAALVPNTPVDTPILSPELLRTHGYTVHLVPLEVVALPATMPTSVQQDQLTARLYRVSWTYIERGPRQESSGSDPMPLIVAIAAGVVALGAAGIATGLATADWRADLTVLGAVGATPGVRRRLALAQAGLIAGAGAVVGAVVGYAMAYAILSAINHIYASEWPGPNLLHITVPWTNMLISVMIVPLVAMAGAGALTRSKLPSERALG